MKLTKIGKAYSICLKQNQRIKEYENLISTCPYYSYLYAHNIIQGRWPEAEPIILKDDLYCYHYAKNIIQGRWIEAEPLMLKDPETAYYYTIDVIKSRWHEAELIIQNSREHWDLYCNKFNMKEKHNWKLGL